MVTITNARVVRTGNQMSVIGQLVFSGNYTTGGDTVNLASVPGIGSNQTPDTLAAASIPAFGGSNSGYQYNWVSGQNISNGKVQVYDNAASGNPDGELAAGAYPAGILADRVIFNAIFNTYSQ